MRATLYQFPTSPLGAKILKLLHYKGVEFETVAVDCLERKEQLLAAGGLMTPELKLPNGETLSDSEQIALRLEELYPEPTILPPDQRGLHLALQRYIDLDLGDALCRAALSDELAYFRRLSAKHEACFRLLRERKYGA